MRVSPRITVKPVMGGFGIEIDEPDKPICMNHADAKALAEYLLDIISATEIEKRNVSRPTAKPAEWFNGQMWRYPLAPATAEESDPIHAPPCSN